MADLTIESVDDTRSAFDDPARPRPVRIYLWEPLVRPAGDQVGDGVVGFGSGIDSALPGSARTSGDAVVQTDGRTRLILLSHGTGASGRDMAWLAEPLTRAGFLVAAVDHHGNNWVDGYLAPGFVFVWERPADLRHALDVIARDRDVDWVGAAGFSAGGYTSAALLGVRVDPDLVKLLAGGEIPEPAIPEFPGAFAWARQNATADQMAEAGGDQSDDRVRAAFLICPGDGGLTSAASLRAVTRPVAIRWGGADVINPAEQNALRYLGLIDGAEGRSLGDDVEHHHLFADEEAGADVRARAAADAVAFFVRVSGVGQPSGVPVHGA